MDLCLGTVQFGMDYGIRGQKQPSLTDSIAMLDYATHNGIDAIDTANAYGQAEDVVGSFLQQQPAARKRIQLISKLRPNLLDEVEPEEYYNIMKENLTQSFARLHTDYLDGYLLHSARYVFDDAIIGTLCRLRQEGYVKKVGVSVYEVEEAVHGIRRGTLDLIQLPYSIFDQRMLQGGVFPLAGEKGCRLHSRSAFIQGLILMEPEEVPPFLEEARPILAAIDTFCRDNGVSRLQLAMGYVKQQKDISHLVFGVDNLDQLREDIALFAEDIPVDLLEEAAAQFAHLDAAIVMPSLWTK